MNDLLNEEEFLPKEYNPKKWFGSFYISAIIFAIIMLTAFRFIRIENVVLNILLGISVGIILPMGAAMAMVFGKKEILLDTKKSKLVKGISILQLCFFMPRNISLAYTFINIYLSEGISQIFLSLLPPIASMIITYALSLIIILPLVNRSRKIKDRILP